MNKKEAIKKLDALEAEAKELRKIIEAPEGKTWSELRKDYDHYKPPFRCWDIAKTKQYKRQNALLTIAYYLQGEILDEGWYIYQNGLIGLTCGFAHNAYAETVFFKDEKTALKAIELYKQYLETE